MTKKMLKLQYLDLRSINKAHFEDDWGKLQQFTPCIFALAPGTPAVPWTYTYGIFIHYDTAGLGPPVQTFMHPTYPGQKSMLTMLLAPALWDTSKWTRQQLWDDARYFDLTQSMITHMPYQPTLQEEDTQKLYLPGKVHEPECKCPMLRGGAITHNADCAWMKAKNR